MRDPHFCRNAGSFSRNGSARPVPLDLNCCRNHPLIPKGRAGRSQTTENENMSVSGNVYGGMIYQTILQTNDPRYYVGQTFTGYYQYIWQGINGTFYATGVAGPAGCCKSLRGLIHLQLPVGNPFGFGPIGLPNTPNDGVLTVSATGQVTAFTWSTQMGDYYVSIAKDQFSNKFLGSGQHIGTNGSIAVMNPILQAAL
ncbi:MAG TPA: hypothetical protein VFJ90_09015 [Candidatus Didemnitutus sp.]|nr:hypothetical protein [Candidatus Didemnitutus sp.]